MKLSTLFFFYLILINLAGFFSMRLDKQKARKGTWRIPEKTLFLFALLLGSLGTFLGMHTFHHKTRHWYFRYGIPVLLLAQVVIIGYFYFRM